MYARVAHSYPYVHRSEVRYLFGVFIIIRHFMHNFLFLGSRFLGCIISGARRGLISAPGRWLDWRVTGGYGNFTAGTAEQEVTDAGKQSGAAGGGRGGADRSKAFAGHGGGTVLLGGGGRGPGAGRRDVGG
jgi:hypothetical protein